MAPGDNKTDGGGDDDARSARLERRRGGLALRLDPSKLAAAAAATSALATSPRVPSEWRAARAARDGGEDAAYHVTVVSSQEAETFSGGGGGKGGKPLPSVADAEVISLGLGLRRGCAYAVVHSSVLTSLRLERGLEASDLHATLGFDGVDEHGVPKGVSTLVAVAPGAAAALSADLDRIRSLPRAHVPLLLARVRSAAEAVARVASATAADNDSDGSAAEVSAALAVALKAELISTGGDAASSPAAQSLAASLRELDPIEAEYLLARARHGQRFKNAVSAAVETWDALHALAGRADAADRRVQWLVGASVLAREEGHRSGVWGASVNEGGDRLALLTLPRNAAPVPGYGVSLWGSAEPSADSARALVASSSTTTTTKKKWRVVTLTEEPLPRAAAEVFEACGGECWHRPIDDRRAPPTLKELVLTCRLVQRNLGHGSGQDGDQDGAEDAHGVLVHCKGGKGRTALVLAGLLVIEAGLAPSAALARVKQNARIVLVTEPQVSMLKALYALVHNPPQLAPSSSARATAAAKTLPRELPRKLVLGGLPGAGKSTFAQALVERLPPGCVSHVNQDELGRAESLDAWSRLCSGAARSSNNNVCTVLDRCHATRAGRAEALALAGGDKAATIVWFTASAEVCAERASARADHVGGISGARGRRVVADMAKTLEPVSGSDAEGFARVHIVSCDADSEELLALWGCGAPAEDAGDTAHTCGVVKFPRTHHLVDLGAATRDDLRVDDASKWLCAERGGEVVVIEEKIDGANMGLRIAEDGEKLEVQNRSHHVAAASHPQWKKLGSFVDVHTAALRRKCLRDRNLILYGEWVYARHSVGYNLLPAYFIAFDLRCLLTGEFVARSELETALAGTGVNLTPLLMRRSLGGGGNGVSLERDVMPLVKRPSSFSAAAGAEPVAAEGVYVRVERSGLLHRRAKIVRVDFVAGHERWDRGPIEPNTLAHE